MQDKSSSFFARIPLPSKVKSYNVGGNIQENARKDKLVIGSGNLNREQRRRLAKMNKGR